MFVTATPCIAHEFWLEPKDYIINVGESIVVDLKNGESFKGITYPYLEQDFSRFEMINAAGTQKISGRIGDTPAANIKAEQEGLHILAYSSTVNTVRYKNFAKFEKFVTNKGLSWVIEKHQEMGFSENEILETYYRYAKTLIRVSSDTGQDTAIGMPIELIAQTNPYSDEAANRIHILLLWQGKPLPGWDVQVFHLPPDANQATMVHMQTNETGHILVPANGGGKFLINAVNIVRPRAADAARNAQWESLWASLTYQIAP